MEGTIFIFAGYKFPPSAQNYSSYLTTNFGSYAPLINQTYSLDKFNSTPYPAFYAMVEVFTDYSFKCPTQRALLNANARGVPVWAYSWGQEPTCPWYSALGSTNAQFLALLNATHTSELPFVFAATDNLPLPNGNCTLNAFEQGLSADVIAAWTSMAANGNPNAKAFSNWPAFTSNSSMGLIVGNGSVTTGALDFTACELWDSINAGILANTTSPAPLSPAPLSPVPSPQASSSPAPHSTNSSSHSGGGLATKGSPPFGILLFWSMLSVVFASRL
jgi:carboxylesterase type B